MAAPGRVATERERMPLWEAVAPRRSLKFTRWGGQRGEVMRVDYERGCRERGVD
jgi:hypothetical protein